MNKNSYNNNSSNTANSDPNDADVDTDFEFEEDDTDSDQDVTPVAPAFGNASPLPLNPIPIPNGVFNSTLDNSDAATEVETASESKNEENSDKEKAAPQLHRIQRQTSSFFSFD